jgi:hypothetical protein
MTATVVTPTTAGVVTALASWQAAVEEVQHDQNPQL